MQYILDKYKNDKNGFPMGIVNADIDDIYENILRRTTEKVLDISTTAANRVSMSEYDKKHLNYFEITYKSKNGDVYFDEDDAGSVIARDEYLQHKQDCQEKILYQTVEKLFETVGEKNVLKFMNSVFSNRKLFDKYDTDNVFDLPLFGHVRKYLKENSPDKENTFLLNVFMAQERLDKYRSHLNNTRSLLVAFQSEPDVFNLFVNQIKLSERMKSDKVRFEFYQFISRPGYNYNVPPAIIDAFADYSGVMEKKGFKFELKETNTFVISRDSLMSLNDSRTAFNYESLLEDFKKEFSSKYPDVLISSSQKSPSEQFLSVEKSFASPDTFMFAFCEAIRRTNFTDSKMISVFDQFLELKKFDVELSDNISKSVTEQDLPTQSISFKL